VPRMPEMERIRVMVQYYHSPGVSDPERGQSYPDMA
jgi:hypothetical protein